MDFGQSLGVENVLEKLRAPEVLSRTEYMIFIRPHIHQNYSQITEQLKSNTNEAIEKGVFGVPTLEYDGEIFWGQDSSSLFQDYMHQPSLVRQGEYGLASRLPLGLRGSNKPSLLKLPESR